MVKDPILIGTEARPGGRIFMYQNKIIMPVQNNSSGYGTGISLYEIHIDDVDKIKLTVFKKWFLKPQTHRQFFTHGMHHFDALVLENDIFVVYDGRPLIDQRKKPALKHFIKYCYLNSLNEIKKQWHSIHSRITLDFSK